MKTPHPYNPGPLQTIPVESFRVKGLQILRRDNSSSGYTQLRRFQSMFGVSPIMCCNLWTSIGTRLPSNSSPEHLLWGLLFLRLYLSEHINSSLASVDEKTFRKWSWKFVELLANIGAIKWNSRFEGGDWLSSYVSVDGADFRIQEPKPFSSQWYSHKFKGAGVRYELGIALKTGKVVAAHGPFPCGSFSDLSIFRLGMKKALLSQETVVADGGYPDEACIQPKDVSNGLLRQHSLYRARHETLNGKMKNFEVLNQRFRHNLSQHGICFFAVANIVQKCIEDGELSFVV